MLMSYSVLYDKSNLSTDKINKSNFFLYTVCEALQISTTWYTDISTPSHRKTVHLLVKFRLVKTRLMNGVPWYWPYVYGWAVVSIPWLSVWVGRWVMDMCMGGRLGQYHLMSMRVWLALCIKKHSIHNIIYNSMCIDGWEVTTVYVQCFNIS